MTTLIAGLVLFLGVHSLSIVNEPLRDRLNAAMGTWVFKGVYSLVSLAGLLLIIWGYEAAYEPGQGFVNSSTQPQP